MKFVFYTNSVSAHQLPLAREIVKRLGADNYRYVYTGENLQHSGQEVAADEPWIVELAKVERKGGGGQSWLDDCEVLMSSIRDIELFERRASRGLTTFYVGERWFKPIALDLKNPLSPSTSFLHLPLPGRLRMLVPWYHRMAKRFVTWTRTDPTARILAVGPWAKKDMLALGVPAEKIVDWGYFVEPSVRSEKCEVRSEKCEVRSEKCEVRSEKCEVRSEKCEVRSEKCGVRSEKCEVRSEKLKVLWVGRPLWWKRVDTIRKAVAHMPNATLDVFTNISPEQVREEMRRHDVYVLASNALEGWGAVVNEALAEGMTCLGTYEAGASAALLPPSNLFHAGDWRALAKMLSERTYAPTSLPAAYTPAGAADRLLALSHL